MQYIPLVTNNKWQSFIPAGPEILQRRRNMCSAVQTDWPKQCSNSSNTSRLKEYWRAFGMENSHFSQRTAYLKGKYRSGISFRASYAKWYIDKNRIEVQLSSEGLWFEGGSWICKRMRTTIEYSRDVLVNVIRFAGFIRNLKASRFLPWILIICTSLSISYT